jgi:hypothetical protein
MSVNLDNSEASKPNQERATPRAEIPGGEILPFERG